MLQLAFPIRALPGKFQASLAGSMPPAKDKIVSPIRMSVGAISLRSMKVIDLLWGQAALYIYRMRHSFQVIWVTAARNPAGMIQLQGFWNGTFHHLVRDAMGVVNHTAYVDLPVSGFRAAPDPQPASGIWLRRNLRHQSFKYATLSSRHCDSFQSQLLRAAQRANAVAARSYYSEHGGTRDR